MPTTRIPLLALAAALASGCGDPASPARDAPGPSPSAALTPCFVEGVRAPALCGKVPVYEDRDARSGRQIPLQVVVIPALAAEPAKDPVFFLAGGPGQAATQIAGFMLAIADRLHERRDLVFVDQRGTGSSGPLHCDAPPDGAPLAERFDTSFDEASIDLCRAGLDADLTKYTTPFATEDLDDVRAALGYGQINLWGTSYGTRAALAYLRAHGDHVRSVVLDSVAPMSLYLQLHTARDAQRALDRLFLDCARDPSCNTRFPDLAARFRSFLDRLDLAPIRAIVRHPSTGAREDIAVDRARFLSTLRGLLYVPEMAAQIPLALDRAMEGDLEPFVALAYEMATSMERAIATGMFLSVVCSEDVPFYRREDIEREAKGTLFGPEDALQMVDACERWPRAPVPKSFRDPVTSDVPVLLLSGDLDPVTPPSWAEDAQKTLRRGTSVVFTGTGHNAASTSCARRIAAAFVERASAEGVDTTCAGALDRPPFLTSFAGSP